MANTTGKKFGGREKGTPNKDSLQAKELADQLGINPFQVLLHFAAGDFEALGYDELESRTDKEGKIIYNLKISPELRQKAAKDACEYLLPKLKSIEISDPGRDDTIRETLEALLTK